MASFSVDPLVNGLMADDVTTAFSGESAGDDFGRPFEAEVRVDRASKIVRNEALTAMILFVTNTSEPFGTERVVGLYDTIAVQFA